MTRYAGAVAAVLLSLVISAGHVLAMENMTMAENTNADAHDHSMFHPLSCNAMLGMLSSPDGCTALSTLLDANLGTDLEIHVPCGECVVVDYASLVDGDGTYAAVLDLRGGINAEGLLHFPPPPASSAFQIRTPHVIVQGELRIDAPSSTAIPANGPDGNTPLELVMTGAEEVTFTPHSENAMACMHDNGVDGMATECNIGKKPIAVAGGKLSVDAMPSANCPSWTRLADVEFAGPTDIPPTDMEGAPQPPPSCPSVIIVDEDFTDLNSASAPGVAWDGFSAGSAQVVTEGTNSYYSVSGRTASWNGPRVALPVSCLTPDVPYLLTYRYRLRHETSTSFLPPYLKMVLKEATTVGSNLEWLDPTFFFGSTNKDHIPAGEWHTVHETLSFPSYQTNASETSELYLYLSDYSAEHRDVTVDVDDFKLELPPSGLYPADGAQVCSSLVRNGAGGQANGHTFPFHASIGTLHAVSGSSDGPPASPAMPYFRSSARSSKWPPVLSQDLQYPGCGTPGQVYELSFSYRAHSAEERYVHASLFADFDGTTNDIGLGIVSCPPSTGNWVECRNKFTLTEDQVGASLLILDVYLAGDDTTIDVDFANVQIELVPDRSAVGTLILEDAAAVSSCWSAGAEVLITSHTIRSSDAQIVKVASVEAGGRVVLETPAYRPVTLADDPSTATEVALLTRNVKFSAEEDDPNQLHGGHLIVLHTPHVAQMLGGVEIVGFGQQGNMGRYPIHFHMSNSAMGSVVSSNTIRDSKQRCLVLHNTDDVHVKSNVAYNTRGHCYILEDGSEQNNILENNLGAVTKPVDVRISTDESDHLPATFWLLNPQNTFVGNVAAGSEKSGFWFEVQARVRGKSREMHPDMEPRYLPLKKFIDNVSHSNGGFGLHTYPQTGYRPVEPAHFENHKSYRNGGSCVFFHAGGKQWAMGGYFADCPIGVEIDGDHSDKVANAVIIGRSPTYQAILDSYGDAANEYPALSSCHGGMGKGFRGIQMDGYLWGGDSATGTIVDGVTFSGLGDDACPGAVNAAVVTGSGNSGHYFDTRNAVSNSVIQDNSNPINLCEAAENGIYNNVIHDKDGSLSGTHSFYVSDSPYMTADSRCISMPSICAAHCPGVCFRSVAIHVSSYAPYDLRLEVSGTNELGEAISTVDFAKLPTYKNPDKTNWVDFHVIYVTLPAGGNYNARFTTESNREETIWPLFADVRWEDDLPNAPCTSDFTLNIEKPEADCSQLIVNGDAGDSASGSIEGWWHIRGDVETVAGGADGSGFAFLSNNRVGSWVGLAQYLDQRCFVEGQEFAFSAKVKLLKDGEPWQCNVNAWSNQPDSCLTATLRSNYGVNNDQDHVGVGTMQTGDQEWNDMAGTFTVRPFDANAGSNVIYFSSAPAGVDFLIDSVSIVPMTAEPTSLPTAPPTSSPTATVTSSPTLSNPPDMFSSNSDFTEKVAFSPDGTITMASQSGGEAVVITKDAHQGSGASSEIDHIVQLQSREIFGTGYQAGLALFFAPEDSTIHHVTTSDNQYDVFEQNVVSTINEKIYPTISGNWLSWRSKTAPDGTSTQQNSRSDLKMSGFYRLRRVDEKAHSYYSIDGTSWTEIGTPFVLPDEYKTAPLKIGARMRRNWMNQYSMTIFPTIISDGPVSSAANLAEEASLPPSFDGSNSDYLDTITIDSEGLVTLAKSDTSGLEGAIISKTAHLGVGSEGDLELLVEIKSREILSSGYQAGLALFFASADTTIADVSSSSYGTYESNVVSTVREKIYAPETSQNTWFNFRSIDSSGVQIAPPNQWSANYKMTSGFLKLERKSGVVTASHSHHNAIWTTIGAPVELPPELKTAPLKIGMRVSRNWNSLYSMVVKPTITSGGVVEATG